MVAVAAVVLGDGEGLQALRLLRVLAAAAVHLVEEANCLSLHHC